MEPCRLSEQVMNYLQTASQKKTFFILNVSLPVGEMLYNDQSRIALKDRAKFASVDISVSAFFSKILPLYTCRKVKVSL
jgi:hypothetical protein